MQKFFKRLSKAIVAHRSQKTGDGKTVSGVFYK
jgi:hypothetical protein